MLEIFYEMVLTAGVSLPSAAAAALAARSTSAVASAARHPSSSSSTFFSPNKANPSRQPVMGATPPRLIYSGKTRHPPFTCRNQVALDVPAVRVGPTIPACNRRLPRNSIPVSPHANASLSLRFLQLEMADCVVDVN